VSTKIFHFVFVRIYELWIEPRSMAWWRVSERKIRGRGAGVSPWIPPFVSGREGDFSGRMSANAQAIRFDLTCLLT
jgi:hypothetical protein